MTDTGDLLLERFEDQCSDSRVLSSDFISSEFGPVPSGYNCLMEVAVQAHICTPELCDRLLAAFSDQNGPFLSPIFDIAPFATDPDLGFLLFAFILSDLGLISLFELHFDTLRRFCHLVLGLMDHTNGYHNHVHAFDVFYSMFLFLNNPDPKLCTLIEPYQCLALLLAAFGHDLGHPGISESFLKALSQQGDACVSIFGPFLSKPAPLEEMHSRLLELILRFTNLLDAPSFDTYREPFNVLVRELILATDMKQHASLIASGQVLRGCPFSSLDPTHRLLFFKLLIKGADLNHAVRPAVVACKGPAALNTEINIMQRSFHVEGVRLVQMNQSDLSTDQVGFTLGWVIPLFDILSECHLALQSFRGEIDRNLRCYREGMFDLMPLEVATESCLRGAYQQKMGPLLRFCFSDFSIADLSAAFEGICSA